MGNVAHQRIVDCSFARTRATSIALLEYFFFSDSDNDNFSHHIYTSFPTIILLN